MGDPMKEPFSHAPRAWWAQVAADSELSDMERRLMIHFLEWLNPGNPYPVIPQQFLSEEWGVSPRAIQYAIKGRTRQDGRQDTKGLVPRGYLSIHAKHSGRRATHYAPGPLLTKGEPWVLPNGKTKTRKGEPGAHCKDEPGVPPKRKKKGGANAATPNGETATAPRDNDVPSHPTEEGREKQKTPRPNLLRGMYE